MSEQYYDRERAAEREIRLGEMRLEAFDAVQDLIEPYADVELPPPDVWRHIVETAFPPPPMADQPDAV